MPRPRSSSSPIEVAPFQDKLAVGYGRSMSEPRGLLFDPATGTAEITYKPEEDGDADDLSRVVPIVSGDDVNFAETLSSDRGVKSAVFVSGKDPFVIGFAKGNAAAAKTGLKLKRARLPETFDALEAEVQALFDGSLADDGGADDIPTRRASQITPPDRITSRSARTFRSLPPLV